MMKCLADNPCLVVNEGEYGTVIGIEPVPCGGYFLKGHSDTSTRRDVDGHVQAADSELTPDSVGIKCVAAHVDNGIYLILAPVFV